ncbi:MAG: glycosyl hydrolase family 79 C-terminal domain-containing protein, partial [Actinomycetota bacterium]|nr:glycosyl hydrolase family 79 C-terminal domain-containing protein [Actinomycetota bacterium]
MRRVLIAGAILALVSVLAGLSWPDHDDPSRAAARTRQSGAAMPVPRRRPVSARPPYAPASGRAAVNVFPDATGPDVPRSYLGLSTEYWALPVFERRMKLMQAVLALLRVPGDGPLVLRVGGDSADHSFWNPRPRRMPTWAFALTPAWLQRTSVLVNRSGARLILDLNLVTDSPGTAAEWARAAGSGLPPHSISGFEIGNEPDLYSRWFWRAVISAGAVRDAVLPRDLTAASYTRDFRRYARSLDGVAPDVPLAGPALANPVAHEHWFRALIAGARHSLGFVSAHRYPYSACAAPGSNSYPTIARLLSEAASAGIAGSLRRPVDLAHRHGLRFRLTELNSVTCGGRPGISNAFATALWAPDALFELMRTGVDSVNLHVRSDAVNAAFALSARGLAARPLLYGLIAFAQTLGTNPRQLVPAPVLASPSVHLKAWAVRDSGNGLHVLLINKGPQAVTVTLRIPASGRASLQRLLAPSAAARSGVTLGGRWLGRAGRWIGRPRTETIIPGPRGYVVTVPRQ